ncbi:MAG TPA: nuclear transport factor 2 family protein [Nocardioides sp.]|uniref:nuclear transport factor 2 family protein n=1 Tax=Nocardioides sp. TaxID=35761 RepID=UPI002E360D5C|nr:nuclear transport factor 2 family protein [Nocardioides sp.]HEX5090024.1 nuclear transport factor 2 family protein [Nocardioides sp.]
MPETLEVVERLVEATNTHDIDTLVACFAADYVNETPAHPLRGFRGRDQVRRNWTSIFAGVPNITARVTASAVDGNMAWTEWEMSGTRRDGSAHAMAGVIIFGVDHDRIVSARFYLEPVEVTSGNVDAAVARALGAETP